MNKSNLQLFKFLITILTLIFSYGCCHEHDENAGIIISDYKIISNDRVYPDCLVTPDTACIRDDSTYKAVIKIDSTWSSCKNLKLPELDFSKVSILINRKFTGGNTYYHRNVIVDSLKKSVTFQITTVNCFCPDKCESLDFNIVLVPKISRDYKIIYK